MRILLIFLFLLLTISCKERNDKEPDNSINFPENSKEIVEQKDSTSSKKREDYIMLEENSRNKIVLSKPTILIIKLDSLEIENAKKIDGEDNFYTAADDMNWYNHILIKKYDSLKIPIIYSKSDYNEIVTPNFQKTIIKDSTFSLYNYFYYDGETLKKEDLFKLISE